MAEETFAQVPEWLKFGIGAVELHSWSQSGEPQSVERLSLACDLRAEQHVTLAGSVKFLHECDGVLILEGGPAEACSIKLRRRLGRVLNDRGYLPAYEVLVSLPAAQFQDVLTSVSAGYIPHGLELGFQHVYRPDGYDEDSVDWDDVAFPEIQADSYFLRWRHPHSRHGSAVFTWPSRAASSTAAIERETL